jgi:hypothetical protein
LAVRALNVEQHPTSKLALTATGRAPARLDRQIAADDASRRTAAKHHQLEGRLRRRDETETAFLAEKKRLGAGPVRPQPNVARAWTENGTRPDNPDYFEVRTRVLFIWETVDYSPPGRFVGAAGDR